MSSSERIPMVTLWRMMHSSPITYPLMTMADWCWMCTRLPTLVLKSSSMPYLLRTLRCIRR